MYKTFVSETDASLFTKKVTELVHLLGRYLMTNFNLGNTGSTDMDINLYCSGKDKEKLSIVGQASKVNQMMDIMEEIRYLQKHLSQLTTQVNEIMQEPYGKNAHHTQNKRCYSSVVQTTIELSDGNDSVRILPQKNVTNQKAQSTRKI